MSPKYPLEAALTLRRQRAEASARALGERVTRTGEAQQALVRAEQERDCAVEAQRATERAELERLERGLERAADLAMAHNHRQGYAIAQARRVEGVTAARRALDDARAQQAEAARALKHAHSEQEAVERHQDDWSRARALEQEQRDDEQALERWSAERFGSGQR